MKPILTFTILTFLLSVATVAESRIIHHKIRHVHGHRVNGTTAPPDYIDEEISVEDDGAGKELKPSLKNYLRPLMDPSLISLILTFLGRWLPPWAPVIPGLCYKMYTLIPNVYELGLKYKDKLG